ncbi:MAG: hypothetical protein A3B91_04875 [Candidatus Yanofskybacteria bacterium RIFCSPHIGHO2_02_FULL_41_29]|uniref:Uncharacterized protein n=1 Tax=Candidatus Yanofskybacteria bacterium RIFCSPHIGHO2_01_FULL_41_53 TaxID=1802663 RepID=A0A1F8EGH5_9BACT|nr:MAG: hypothetical protein A2650_01485 [Candidatus Yanofskybacteria bacterium RIFCSPHIGHO2_01_FULL_41_53]OGN11154.1 MAG: hypothetical protein A3B91_04875 [Candidatus Yanofskybacteria bacterium RIFCSPHIGHO2_02_FULL_41_29]OGN22068.1 MAG: hypothetical protein A2916_00095 [Candidatus Yanofskybacteria bacterium RIFCSPLOWO2_01_FULL_41_67]OGN28521.1 MAG: hypothetical protein A3H54_04655 [Candidatus Yanofskybacteria bacterium RIFCSPLOWO2_02_FULL_41_13]OGN35166.1 MAG: hypothetical protein A3F98_01650 
MKEVSYFDKNIVAVNIFTKAVRKAVKQEADKIKISSFISEKDQAEIRAMVDGMIDKLSLELLRVVKN